MTGFEKYIQSKGYSHVDGSINEFNSYDNVSRVWQKNKTRITIGLTGFHGETIIGIVYPHALKSTSWRGLQSTTFLPSQINFESVLLDIESGETTYPKHLWS